MEPIRNRIYKGKSKIQGVGILARRNIRPKEFIGVAIGADKLVTKFGSKINHSYTPNCILAYSKKTRTYKLYAITNIIINEEITANYYYTPFFIAKPKLFWD